MLFVDRSLVEHQTQRMAGDLSAFGFGNLDGPRYDAQTCLDRPRRRRRRR